MEEKDYDDLADLSAEFPWAGWPTRFRDEEARREWDEAYKRLTPGERAQIERDRVRGSGTPPA